MFAFNSSQPLTPYLEVVRAAGWFLLLSKGTASSFATALPTWKDWNADAKSLTDTYRYGLSCRTQCCFWSFLDVTCSVSPWRLLQEAKYMVDTVFQNEECVCQLTSCKKSATPFLSGHLNPRDEKNSSTLSRGPWYTICPSESSMMSSKRSYVSGAGCSKEMRAVPPRMWIACLSDLMIWYVVELSVQSKFHPWTVHWLDQQASRLQDCSQSQHFPLLLANVLNWS